MNKAFLGTAIYKSVMLADRDRIDKDLVIAQHMGKFRPIFC